MELVMVESGLAFLTLPFCFLTVTFTKVNSSIFIDFSCTWYKIRKVPSEGALAYNPASSPPSPEVTTLSSFWCFLLEMFHPDLSPKGKTRQVHGNHTAGLWEQPVRD